jgi:hypothetical protein
MKRVSLVEAFGEDLQRFGENATGNEGLMVKIVGGTLDFLTHSEESDDETIRSARFVHGELQLENGQLFTFWVAGSELGSGGDTTVYRTMKPQAG